MLLIVSSTKPAKLYPILAPLLEHAEVEAKVATPQQLQTGDVVPTPAADTLLLMGAKAFEFLQHAGLVKPKTKLGSCREKLFNLHGNATLVTFDVNLLDFVPEVRPDILWDVNLAVRFARTGTLKPQVGQYSYVDSFGEFIQWAQGLDQEVLTPITLDLETLGLDEFDPKNRILTVQLSCMIGKSAIYRVPEDGEPSPEVRAQLEWLFSRPWLNTVGANLKYDLRWLAKKWHLTVSNHRFDTQLVGGLLDENRFNSLKAHCKEYAPELGGYETEFEDSIGKKGKERMDLALQNDPEGFKTYAGGDTDAALRIYVPLRRELLKDQTLARFYTRLLQPASQEFRKLESRGILIDQARYAQLHQEALAEQAQQHADALAMMSNHIKYKYADNLKLSRDVIIREHMFGPYGLGLTPVAFTEKEKLPSCSFKDHLQLFLDHPEAGPFVKKLKEYNATSKTISTYIVGFLAHLRSDGYFHPSYILAKGGQAGDEDEGGGTNTGRSSCKDPAYQTWPKRTSWAKRLRSVVIPPPGYVIVKFDFSQGELRIMGDASNCKGFIEAYKKGLDLHAITAAGFLGLTLEQFFSLPDDQIEMARYLAKAGNFGLIYRISPEGFMVFAAQSYNVKLTLPEAEKRHGEFFGMYPEIDTYHDDQVAHARKHGWVRNQLGRVRHLPLIKSPDNETRGKQERQAINAPTQGCLFDMMMLLMVQIGRVRPDIWMFGNTHDSLELYLKEDTWQEDARLIKQLAENLPLHEFDWSPKVPFVVDCEMSPKNLGVLEKYKLIGTGWVSEKELKAKKAA